MTKNKVSEKAESHSEPSENRVRETEKL